MGTTYRVSTPEWETHFTISVLKIRAEQTKDSHKLAGMNSLASPPRHQTTLPGRQTIRQPPRPRELRYSAHLCRQGRENGSTVTYLFWTRECTRDMISCLGKGAIMSRRTTIMLAASAVAGIASVALVSTDALAAKKKASHPAVAVVAPAPVYAATGIDNHYGPVAAQIPKCFDSVILYPVPPCY